VLPLQRSVAAVQERVERKRDDLQWLRSMAPQLTGLQVSARRRCASRWWWWSIAPRANPAWQRAWSAASPAAMAA
jgi:hypothetical protein